MSSTDLSAPRFGSGGLRPRITVGSRDVPADLLLLGAVVAIAAAIRIITIDNQSLWTDEALTAYETHLPFGAMINTVAHYETTPPLYFVLIWCWAKLFGSGAIALRSLSAICGVALVPLTYLCGRHLISRWTGVLAAAFVAVNPLMVWYSQEARSYMLLTTLTTVGLLCFIRALGEPSRRNLAWWTAVSSLALMTHFFAGFIVAPEAVWLLWRWRSRVTALAVGVVAAVQLAMLPFAVIDTSHGTEWIHGIPRTTRIAQLVLEWSVGTIYRRAKIIEGFLGGLALLVVLGLLYRFGGDRELRKRAKLPAAIALFVLLAPLMLGLLGRDFFLSRNAIPAFVPVAVVVAGACLLPRLRLPGVALAVVLLATFSVATARVQTHSILQRPQWRDVAAALGPDYQPRAVIAADGTTADPLKLYLPHVSWVQNQLRPVTISEVDIIGLRGKRLRLVSHRVGDGDLDEPPAPLRGTPAPQRIAPRGTWLLARFRVDNWIVARFVFERPVKLTIRQLIARAPQFFIRTPRSVLVFVQRPR